jgi:hypothetical protein
MYLCRLNRLPRSSPFWARTNLQPTIHKLREFCRHLLESDPQDTLALWTQAALEVSWGVDRFGYEQWKALRRSGDLDVTWPICAALLQGGRAGHSYRTLPALLLDMGAIEEARPVLEEYADSELGNSCDWAKRVLIMIDRASAMPGDGCD